MLILDAIRLSALRARTFFRHRFSLDKRHYPTSSLFSGVGWPETVVQNAYTRFGDAGGLGFDRVDLRR